MLAAGARAWAQQGGAVPDDAWQRRDTTYFTIYYTAAGADAMERYASVVDGLYEYVAAAFDHGPTAPVPSASTPPRGPTRRSTRSPATWRAW